MYGEIASVKGIVSLPIQKALDEAQSFLAKQGYTAVRRTDTTLTAVRRTVGGTVEDGIPNLTVKALPQTGGVRMVVIGNDHEGVRERQDAWSHWAESLPRQDETQRSGFGNQETTLRVPTPSVGDRSQVQTLNRPESPSFRTTADPSTPMRQSDTRQRGSELVLGGCVVTLVIVALLLLGIVVLVPTGDDNTAESGSESPGGSQPVASVQEPLTVGGVTWTVISATQANEITQEGFGQFGETKRGNFVIVDFAFTNDSNDAVTLDSASLALVDGSGRKSEPDPDTFGYVPPGKDIFLENVNPGVTRQGQVVFTVAPGASGFKLQAGDTNPFSGENGYVDLGF